MLSAQQITDILQQKSSYLRAEYGVKRIGFFGSYAKGTAHEQSDIDLVAEFEIPLGLKFMEFTDYLESLFQTSVDVLTPAGISGIRNARVARNIRESVIYVQ